MANHDAEEALAILHAVLALGRRMRSERPDGAVTLSALSVLGTLGRSGPMLATQLAAAERLQPQSLTRIITGLERHGLIERMRSEIDGRALLIAVTDKGHAVLAGDLAARQAWLEQAMTTTLSVKERRILAAAARAMRKLAFSKGDTS